MLLNALYGILDESVIKDHTAWQNAWLPMYMWPLSLLVKHPRWQSSWHQHGPTWVFSATDRPHVGTTNLTIRVCIVKVIAVILSLSCLTPSTTLTPCRPRYFTYPMHKWCSHSPSIPVHVYQHEMHIWKHARSDCTCPPYFYYFSLSNATG